MSTIVKTVALIVLTGILAFSYGCAGKLDKPRFCNLSRRERSFREAKGARLAVHDLKGNTRNVRTRYPVELRYPLIFHPAPLIQPIGDGKLGYLALNLRLYDPITDKSSILVDSDPPKGQITSYYFSSTGSDFILIRSWQGSMTLSVYNWNTDREVSCVEDNTTMYLTSNCVSPEGRYFFVIHQYHTYSVLRVFDLVTRTEVAFAPEITSTKPFSIAWNPWGQDGKLAFSRRDSQDLWESFVIDIPKSMVTEAGATGYDSITPCFLGDRIVVVERAEQESGCRIALYDGNKSIPVRIFNEGKASFNPMTFSDQHFFLFVESDGQKSVTMFYEEGMKTPVGLLESADPKPSLSRTGGLLLLAQQFSRQDFFRSEGTCEHPFISSPKLPASLYVLDLDTYSKSKVAEDSLYACWID